MQGQQNKKKIQAYSHVFWKYPFETISSARIDYNYCQLVRGITDLNPIIYQQICYKINKTKSKRQTLLQLLHCSTQPNGSKTPTLSLYTGDRAFEHGTGQWASVLTFLGQFKRKPRHLATSRERHLNRHCQVTRRCMHITLQKTDSPVLKPYW